ncbi:FAD/NAD(P)-binding domain-containing protein [Penicillium brevicompactum]|uniref:FAD/NAD(P)-binding domain-containing protein n=1 Tax=Penicillium brevicompactum TaxID=5074 RepID=UPI0025401964|nr:FAD/NAD(P)-binding domain-containing protein [Penicillium brevicompactum]KAJ5332659.1 FAD/NAD(P)-binding domain-containing protein [Penicillium brevicompactum]
MLFSKSRGTLPPQVGASIGILPNGARVLDQLQLYDAVESLTEPLSTATIGYADGFSFSSSYPKIINERFGFPIAFLDRQKLLEILYLRYPHHEKIRLGEKVTSIENLDNITTVTTEDGSSYQGNLVIGADGVHSMVRQEIWRFSEESNPSSRTVQERSDLTAEFRCIFGISSPIKGLNAGEQVNSILNGVTIVTIHGKNGRLYWFVIQKLDQKYTYPHFPRYTKDDTRVAAEQLKHLRFHKHLTFGQLWGNRETASMTTLEENTFKTWHHGRLALLGDSVHKMTPNIGQGANMAIEDAAALTNLLRDLLAWGGTSLPTDTQIDTLLHQYRAIRHGRVYSIYRSSRFLVRFQARDGLINSLLSRYYAPHAGDLPAEMASKTIADGVMLNFLPPPKRSGAGWEKYRKKERLWSWNIRIAIVLRPVDYLLSIPGKDIRGKLIDAFNEWLQVPPEKLAIIKGIIDMLHTASLLVDDIQDASRLRRGHPVAHEIFGVAQTINSANYAYFLQQERLRELNDPRAFHIFTQALLDLHRGQGMDLYWRDSIVCPTEEEYHRMVIYKTGGLFRLALELMQTQSMVTTDLSKLIDLLGLIFQIRDDYMNLQSGEYAEKKGSMEDLTEGKFSYPVIHSINAVPENTILVDILKQRSEDNEIKMRAVQYMESTGSYAYCREVLSRLNKQARSHVEDLEASLGPNHGVHFILDLLHVDVSNRKTYK